MTSRLQRDQLSSLDKEALIDKIIQLDTHVYQLRRVIAKSGKNAVGDGPGSADNVKRRKAKPRDFDFNRYKRQHVALKIAYLGAEFHGYVVQEDSDKTIEAALFAALLKAKLIESRETSNYHRCGRTDVGVSAYSQVVSIDLRTNEHVTPDMDSAKNLENPVSGTDTGNGVHAATDNLPHLTAVPMDEDAAAGHNSVDTCARDRQSINVNEQQNSGANAAPDKHPPCDTTTVNQAKQMRPFCYMKVLNRLLPPEIAVLAWTPVPSDFSARFSCLQRTYKYFFPAGGLDLERMRQASQRLVGEHDFRNFCKMDVGGGVTEFVRRIVSIQISHCVENVVSCAQSVQSDGDVAMVANCSCPGFSSHQRGIDIDFDSVISETCVKSQCYLQKNRTCSLCTAPTAACQPNPKEDGYSLCVLTVTANAFLWHQIRCIVSVLFLVGEGKESPDVVDHLLDISTTPRKPQYPLASELPLVLWSCEYDGVQWMTDEGLLPSEFEKVGFKDNAADYKEGFQLGVQKLQRLWLRHAVQAVILRAALRDLGCSLGPRDHLRFQELQEDQECATTVEGRRKRLCENLTVRDLLTSGARSRTYVPLLQRATCEDLESRIRICKRRKKNS